MNPLAIVAGIPVLITLFGVIKRKRFFFLLGYFLYALLVVGAEMNNYMETNAMQHLMIAALWAVQGALAFPNKLNYDGSKVFKSFAIKTFIAFILINLIGIFVAKDSEAVPKAAEYYHGILMVFPMIATFLMLTNRVPVQDN